MLMGGPCLNSGQQDEEEYRGRRGMEAGGGSRSAEAEAEADSESGQVIVARHLHEIRRLLITCADLISQSDLVEAHRLLSLLSDKSSPYGDSTERLLHHFSRALIRRLNTTNATIAMAQQGEGDYDHEDDDLHYSCYLTLNQITPFIRFTHLTANQAILESIEVGTEALHILDFDIMHGLQWPPFMQALTDRSSSSPPPSLRITATGYHLPHLRRTGERLLRFAHSLGLRFHFQPLILPPDHEDAINLIIATISATATGNRHEALAVNCVLYLHRLLGHDSRNLRRFLEGVKALNPRVVTLAEREASLGGPLGPAMAEALDHYAAIFESLEATLPANSRERLAVEKVWLSREIAAAVAPVSPLDQLRSQRYESWEGLLRACGFSNVPLSPFALSQAKLLLRLHYPSEGFQLHIFNHSFFLGWQNRPLFSLSSWH